MQKVFHFDAPRKPYQCDGAIVWCFDHRFDLGFRKFLKRIGVSSPDSIKIAGGAKVLSSPDRESDREFILDQIRTSIRLHCTRRVILMAHSDCGAYGGLTAFGNDPQAEAARIRDELGRAAAVVSEAISGIQVDGYFVDFEGIWQAVASPMAQRAS